MAAKKKKKKPPSPPSIFIVSGGEGTSGEQIIRTALAQFEEAEVKVVILPHMRREEQIQKAVDRAAASGGTIIHTLVDAGMRRALTRRARASNVIAIDLMGRVLTRLSSALKQRPAGRPGLFRQLHEEYFERVQAIEFTVAHDDGRNVHELDLAEIVLIGVSRVGKTPLSMYLAMLGWQVANIPLIPDLPPPEQLAAVDPRRVIGLTISPDQLIIHRQVRSRRMQVREETDYTRADSLHAEQQMVRTFCRKRNFPTLDVTDKPIEESADEVITLITRRLEKNSHRPH